MKRVAWVRAVVWCNTHDIPWASHAELGVSDDGCNRGERMIKDEELTKKIGEPGGTVFDPEQTIIIEKVDGEWPLWSLQAMATGFSGDFLDALAAAQPKEEA